MNLQNAVLVILAAVLTPVAVTAEPFVPKDDAQVLERLPVPTDAVQRKLRRLRAELSREPRNLPLALRLTRRYIRLSRAEYEPRYNGYAQAALSPWWSLPEPPAPVLLMRATLLQNRHNFNSALADLDRVLSLEPRNAQAWFTRAVILQVLGRYPEAVQSCLRMGMSIGMLARASCITSAASLNGKAAQSYKMLRAALARSPRADPGLRLWALTTLAEIAARNGDHEAAERHFRKALSLGRKDGYLLGAYADFLLDLGRAGEVRDLLAGETRPDGFLLRLALAEQQLGAPELKARIETLRARFAASRMRRNFVHLREEARFTLHLLKEPAKALRLAKENWGIHREPVDTRILLETALAAKAPSEAKAVLDWVKKSRLEDVKILPLARQLQGASQ